MKGWAFFMYKDIFKSLREAALVRNNMNTRRTTDEPAPLPQKSYPEDSKLIALPEPDFLEDKEVSFLELMELRSTIRLYSDQKLKHIYTLTRWRALAADYIVFWP